MVKHKKRSYDVVFEAKTLNLVLCFGILVRALTSLYPYSGKDSPPMFGDYEAQRHWQEITFNLPTVDWYENTVENNLTYWGLDYPPLTAYHSLVLGHVANQINSSYIQLQSSHGIDTPAHKNFMRATVLLADLFIYLPALLYCCKAISKNHKSIQRSSILEHLTIVALYPGQILIDNGHFQYNNISLGLAAFSIGLILNDRSFLSAIFFVCALNYKQMELYHSLPIFFYLLRYCFGIDKR